MLAFLKSAGAGSCSVCFPFLQVGTRRHILGHDGIPYLHS
jgi:hypothetical protein